ncbi:MAG: hypothetical protein LLG00_02500, partial [Planctomycetaceae bacterium]|nr:hypothetical protein [Planctomycetaceae bacterium]
MTSTFTQGTIARGCAGSPGAETAIPSGRFDIFDRAAFWLALAFLLSLLLPQLNSLWLRGSCPVFATWLLLSLWNGSLVSVVQRLRGRFAMAGAFLCVLFVNVLLR